MPDKKYHTILADPPWNESGGGKCKRGADRHYPLMHVKQIAQVMSMCGEYKSADADCHLYLWATNNFLPDALWLMGTLGFRYVTNTVWVKVWERSEDDDESVIAGRKPLDIVRERLQLGLGQYQRGAHELLFFGTRGITFLPITVDRLPSVVFAERGKHSQKPESFYSLIEARSRGPYLEMFARNKRDGWNSWGNEV